MRFNIGDKVRCINPGKYAIITLNNIYTVKSVGTDNHGNYIDIDDDHGRSAWFYSNRFELVDENKEPDYLELLKGF